jgi:hypothetical protein
MVAVERTVPHRTKEVRTALKHLGAEHFGEYLVKNRGFIHSHTVQWDNAGGFAVLPPGPQKRKKRNARSITERALLFLDNLIVARSTAGTLHEDRAP